MRPGIFFVGHPVSKSWAAAAVAKELGIIELGANMCVWIYVCVCVCPCTKTFNKSCFI